MVPTFGVGKVCAVAQTTKQTLSAPKNVKLIFSSFDIGHERFAAHARAHGGNRVDFGGKEILGYPHEHHDFR